MTDSDLPFYLGINHTKNPKEKPLFKASAMGVKLNSLMKTMADKAGFDEKRRLTNHSARKIMIQKLNDNNIPLTHIMQLSGHRNVQSVNNYSTVSNEQQKLKHVFDSELKHYKYVYRKKASVKFSKWNNQIFAKFLKSFTSTNKQISCEKL